MSLIGGDKTDKALAGVLLIAAGAGIYYFYKFGNSELGKSISNYLGKTADFWTDIFNGKSPFYTEDRNKISQVGDSGKSGTTAESFEKTGQIPANLNDLQPNFRYCVKAFLNAQKQFIDLAAFKNGTYGFFPYEILRTEARQKVLLAKGTTKTLKSLHLKQPDGFARAVDFVWSTDGGNKFWAWDNGDYETLYTYNRAMKTGNLSDRNEMRRVIEETRKELLPEIRRLDLENPKTEMQVAWVTMHRAFKHIVTKAGYNTEGLEELVTGKFIDLPHFGIKDLTKFLAGSAIREGINSKFATAGGPR